MKARTLLYLAALTFLLTSTVFSLGFKSVFTPDGVYVIAVGDEGKIYRSVNGGNSWAGYTYLTANMNSVCAYGNDVWIASDNGNIYKTGKTHSPITTYNTGDNFTVNSVHFIDANNGFICGTEGRVYKSVNGGVNWTLINSGISNIKLNSISFKDNLSGVAAGDNGWLYLTDNGGATWTVQSSGTTRNLLKAKYFQDGIIVVGEYGTIITKEISGSWTSVVTRTNSDIRGITGSGINNARVCGGGGFIRSNLNKRQNFFNFEVNPMQANLVDIFYFNGNTGFAVSSLNYAIIRTTNAGASWELPAGSTVTKTWSIKLTSSSGIGNNLCMHPSDRNAAYVAYGSKIYVSRNRGENWIQIATMTGGGITGGRAHSFYVSPLDTNIMMAAIDNVAPDKVVRSTDHGLTWAVILSDNFSSYGQPLEMDQNDPNIFYFVPDGGGFWRSTNSGATFTEVSTFPFLSPCDIIVMHDSSNVLYLGESSPSRVYKSVDSGSNWALVLTSSGSEIPSIANSVFDKSAAYATTFSTLLWKTTNYGTNWVNIFTQTTSNWGSDVCHEDPTLYLNGTYGGSTGYLTLNSGSSFTTSAISGGGSGAGIMIPERGYLLAQQTGSLFKMNINYSVITELNENILSTAVPSDYELFQNYPNPFNPSTNIKFALPKSGNVSLKVYDRLGKEVNSLSEGFRNAGTYEINFDASSLSSGVYFYKLVTDEASVTKKLMLIK